MGQISTKESKAKVPKRSQSLPANLDKSAATPSVDSDFPSVVPKKLSVKQIAKHTAQIREQLDKKQLSPEDIQRFKKVVIDYSKRLGNKPHDNDTQKLIATTLTGLIRAQDEVRQPGGRLVDSSLGEIENRFDALQVDIVMATENRQVEIQHLDTLAHSIETLMADLQRVRIERQVHEHKKNTLERNLRKSYQKIDKTKNLIRQSENQTNINTELAEELENIERAVLGVNLPTSLDQAALQDSRNQLHSFKLQLFTHEEADDESVTKTNKICNEIERRLQKIKEFETVIIKLNATEKDIVKVKGDLSQFIQTPQSETYRKYKKYFKDMGNYVKDISEMTENSTQKKQEILLEISDCLKMLDQKAGENEENAIKLIKSIQKGKKSKITKQPNVQETVEESDKVSGPSKPEKPCQEIDKDVVLREKKKRNESRGQAGFTPFNTFVVSFEEFSRSFTIPENPEQLAHFSSVLWKIKNSLDEKLAAIEAAVNSAPQKVELVNVKWETLPVTEHITEPQKATVSNGTESIDQIKNMKQEVEELHEKIKRKSVFEKNGDSYRQCKGELEAHKKTLTRLRMYNNDRIQNSAEDLAKHVDFVLQVLDARSTTLEKPPVETSRRSTSQYVLNEVMSIRERISDLAHRINALKTVSEMDYNSLEKSLNENIKHLENLSVLSNPNISKSRDDVLQGAKTLLSRLEEIKNAPVNNSGDPTERDINDKLGTLKNKISRFTGTFNNVLYKTLEADLTRLLNQTEGIADKTEANRINAEIKNNLKILEQKSNKDSNYALVYSRNPEESIKLGKIKTDVENIVVDLNPEIPLSKSELEVLERRLNLATMDLDLLDFTDDKVNQEKEQLYEKIRRYLAFIGERLKMVQKSQQRLVVGQTSVNQTRDISEAAQEFRKVEEILKKVAPEIQNFVGSDSCEKFYELDEVLVETTIRLDNFKVPRDDPLGVQKYELLSWIQQLSVLLDERCAQTEFLEDIERIVGQAMMKIDSLATLFSDEEYNKLDEHLINLKLKLHGTNFNEQLNVRKNATMKNLDCCMKKLNEAAANRAKHTQGTLV